MEGDSIKRRLIFVVIAALLLVTCIAAALAAFNTPSAIAVFPDMVESIAQSPLSIKYDSEPAANYKTETETLTARLFGLIPVKTVSVGVVERRELIPCGLPFGVKLYTDGVMIVGMSDVETNGGKVNPAYNAGMRIGDIITQIDGKKVRTNEQVASAIGAGGKTVLIEYTRDGKDHSTKFTPVLSSNDGVYRAGLWVRDSTAGIGTITFIDPLNLSFGGLGHGICDVDTGSVMPMLKGSVVAATIEGVKKGKSGEPGELFGVFNEDISYGSLTVNSEHGVFGIANSVFSSGDALPAASAFEIKEGFAQIYTTVEGAAPQVYEIKITKILRNSGRNSSKNMVIEITDEKLLKATGGIVQGMSGSPIVQNGKIIGAVTHVLVNDPKKGYGIFIENMLSSVENALI